MKQPSESFSDLLRQVLTKYPLDQIGEGISTNNVRDVVERQLCEVIRETLRDEELVVKGSAGQGRWTAIPWVAIMDSRETERIQKGIYVVYLFEPQEDRVTLTLNQGVTSLKDDLGTRAARGHLKERADEVSSTISLEGFSTGPLEFPHASSRNELYGPGTIFYKRYSLDALPDDETLESDLQTLVNAYQDYISTKKTDTEEPTVYQCPIKPDGAIGRNYERTVRDGVSREQLEDISELPTDRENLRVWGNRSETPARAGDYLLFAERDGRYSGEYTTLARIADTTILDPSTAEVFAEAVGWNEEIDDTFPHVMFLEPLYEADLDRETFWNIMGFAGWPNDTYSPIDFDRDDSTFFTEYDSVQEFVETIEGDQLYPQPTEPTVEYWQEVHTRQRKAETFLSNPTEEHFVDWLDSFPWYGNQWGESTAERLFQNTTPREVAERIEDAAASGNIGPVLDLTGFGISSASQALAAVAPRKFSVLDSGAADALETLQFDRPNPNTNSVDRYESFLEDVEKIIERYPLREYAADIPTWATGFQVADYVFTLHDSGKADLSDLVPTNPLAELATLLDDEAAQARLYRRAAAHLVAGKNVVFYGPPGTGKTRAAELLTDALCASRKLATANAEWSNYQVVGGYQPAGGSWEPKPGFLTEAVNRCTDSLRRDTPQPSWLIIDELNRANLDEAFGDVFTLLDIDYRTQEPLSYADEAVYVPLSFRILATMNTYDQAQLFSLGYAFRRRFAFVDVPSLLQDQETQETALATDAPQTTPTLDSSGREVVDLVREAAVESLTTGTSGEGITTQDVAPIFPEFASEERIREAVEAIRTDAELQTDGLDGIETLVYFCVEITDRDVVDIGQALVIDAVKYLIAYRLLFPEETSRTALDDAIVAYIVPQLEHFMSDLRRAETIDRDSDAAERFEQIVQLARDLYLPRTASVLESAAESKRILS